jgi:hypothetical protein
MENHLQQQQQSPRYRQQQLHEHKHRRFLPEREVLPEIPDFENGAAKTQDHEAEICVGEVEDGIFEDVEGPEDEALVGVFELVGVEAKRAADGKKGDISWSVGGSTASQVW